MNVRKRNAHRARLSFEKPTGYMRQDGKLKMWNTRSMSARLRNK